MIIIKLTWRYWSKWDNIISAAFKVLSIFSWAFLIECVLICNTQIKKIQLSKNKNPQNSLQIPKIQYTTWPSQTQVKSTKNPNLKIKFLNKKSEIDLSWTHGGFKGRKTVVKGTKNGDNVVCNCLAFLKRLSHHGCFYTQWISTTHCYTHLLLLLSCFRQGWTKSQVIEFGSSCVWC